MLFSSQCLGAAHANGTTVGLEQDLFDRLRPGPNRMKGVRKPLPRSWRCSGAEPAWCPALGHLDDCGLEQEPSGLLDKGKSCSSRPYFCKFSLHNTVGRAATNRGGTVVPYRAMARSGHTPILGVDIIKYIGHIMNNFYEEPKDYITLVQLELVEKVVGNNFHEEVSKRVAVVLGGKGVDANLRILQVLKDAWRTVERVAVTNRARNRRCEAWFPWEFAEGSECMWDRLGFLQGLRPEDLASRSLVAKLISQDIDG
ncbi:hypothetical protein Taro_034848 [Colocasia esculenta]|uniref:Uncharacterized protein n=1 Tax=Colocasia esculenta TaxID=4460 RepID=A0A843W8T3_COLES|nr:hypothetical protein [Colocasia esculenta]